MLQVFRVEHRQTRVGPFQTDTEFTQRLARQASEQPTLKHPGEDGLGLANIPWFYVFGCHDLASLRSWFLLGCSDEENKDIVRQLHQMDFVLAEYLVEADRYCLGDSQVQLAFDADDCRREGLVAYHAIDELLSQRH